MSTCCLVLSMAVAFAACDGRAARSAELERCDAGMKRALRAKSRGSALQTFLDGCAGLYEDHSCQAAQRVPAGEPSDDWLVGALSTCATAYCPRLSSKAPHACGGEALVGPDAFDQAWVELAGAIFEKEGREVAGGVVLGFIRFFGDLNTRLPARRGVHRITADAVARCEKGIENANAQPTRREELHEYYKECASMYEAECRSGFEKAMAAAPEEQRSIVLLECRKTYCTWLSVPAVEACDGEFVPSLGAVARAWPPLNRAILELDDKADAERLASAMARVEARAEDP